MTHRLIAYQDRKSGKTSGFLQARTGPDPLPAEMARSFTAKDIELAEQSSILDTFLPRATIAAKYVPKAIDDFVVVFA